MAFWVLQSFHVLSFADETVEVQASEGFARLCGMAGEFRTPFYDPCKRGMYRGY